MTRDNVSPRVPDAQQLLDTDRAFAAESSRSGAAEAFHRFLDEDALLLPDGAHPISGRAAICERLSRSLKGASLEWVPQHAEVAASGEMGWTWGTFRFSAHDAAGSVTQRAGKYLNVWTRGNAGWKVRVDIGNGSPPGAEAGE